MKKQLYTVAGLLLAGAAGAQTQKGNGLISGSVSVNYTQTDYQRINADRYTWRPVLDLTAGRFVANNWLLGLSVAGTWSSEKTENPIATNQIQRTFNQRVNVNLTPFMRRYWQFAPVQVFAGAGLSVSTANSRLTTRGFAGTSQQSAERIERNTGFQVGPYLEAGVNYFLTNRLALQLSASTRSLPLNVAGLSTGLVYWTGADQKADPQTERENGQTNRGNWVVEGGFFAGHSSTKLSLGPVTNQIASVGYSISPAVGYFTSKNNVLGISIPLGVGTTESNGQNLQSARGSNWSVGISPYFQHYWASTRLTPYTRVSITYATFEYKTSSNTNKTSSLSTEGSIGLAYMAGQRFIVETSLANASLIYRPSDAESGAAYKSWDTTLSAGLRGNFAVRYVLTRTN